MALRSLIVKVGADVTQIDQALAKVGSSSKTLADGLKKLGDTPIGQQAQKDAERLQASMDALQKGQQRVADTAKLAATGIDAIGGPARLTTSQLGEMNRTLQSGLDAFRALGQQAPKELQKVADAVAKQQAALKGASSGGSLFGGANDLLAGLGVSTGLLTGVGGGATLLAGAKAAVDYADSLTKLSDRTGITTTALQRLESVATPSGNSLEEVANAVNQFQRRIADGDETAAAALDRIGLSVGQLRALSPDEQFFAIAKAIEAIKDPAEQTRTAVELFGRSGAELLPTLKANIDGLKDATVTMSDASVKALDDFGDGFVRLKTSAVNILGDLTGSVLALVSSLGQLPEAMERARAAAAKRAPGERPPNVAIPDMLANFGPNGLNVPHDVLVQLTPDQIAQLVQGLAVYTAPKPASTSFPEIAGLPNAASLLPKDLPAFLKDSTVATQRLIDANTKEAEAANALKVANDALFGVELIQRATLYTKALGDIGNVSKLTGAEQSALLTIVQGSIDVYRAQGLVVPPAIQAVADALQAEASARNIEAQSINTALPLYGANQLSWQQMTNIAKGLTSEGLIPLAKGLDDAGRAARVSADDAAAAAARLKNLQTFVATQVPLPSGGPSSLTQALSNEGQGVDLTKQWETELSGLSRAFSDLATIGGASFGGIAKDIGLGISQMNAALHLVETLKTTLATFKDLGLSRGESAAILGAGIVGGALSGDAAHRAGTDAGSVEATAGGALSGAAEGAVIGTVIPGIGTAVGAAVPTAPGRRRTGTSLYSELRAAAARQHPDCGAA